MIDVKAIERTEKNPQTGLTFLEEYKLTLKNRGADPALADRLLELNNKRKVFLTQMETSRSEQNRVGEEIARRKRSKEDASTLLQEMQKLSSAVKELDRQAQGAEEELRLLALELPNKLHPSVPIGQSAEDNVIVRTVGERKKLNFRPREHTDLGVSLGILDFERAGKVSGARFAFLRGAGATIERGLIQFMMDMHSREHGYEEMIPPFLVNTASMIGTNQFPKFRDDSFHIEGLDLHLIPTAEVPVTNFFAGEILREAELPIQFCAYSPCFRSEAGSYGKDTKGLIRQHQFDKVELVIFSHPSESYELHEKLTSHAERILQTLELPYRVASLCSRDIGFGAARCYDLEVWLPGQGQYREISSCSNFEDFQARRANIRFRGGDKEKPQFVHTLNGSGLAIGRTLIAILENGQQEDGSVVIPEALVPYIGGRKRLAPKSSL
jgi:seryl-tRNA synthetase